MAGIPPVGDISPTCLKTYDIIPNINNNISSNNNNNVVLSLNKFKALPPISNIPGLNPDSDKIAAAEKKTFRTFKIREADSSYVKLAKQGGRKNLLEYKEYANKENKALFRRAVDQTSEEIEVDNNNNNNDINDNNNNNTKNYNSGSAGKSIMDIKKQAKNLKEKKSLKVVSSTKERPDILPVDNTEILKHLSAPRRPLLPKLRPQAKLSARFLRMGAR